MKNLIFLIYLLIYPLLTYGQEIPKFEYEARIDAIDSSLITIEAKLINESNKSIYFLSESCNGLDYYLKTNHSNIKPYIMIHCNATFPRKIEIKPNSEYVFNSRIRKEKNLTKIGLTLTLVKLDSTTKVEGKFIGEIQKEYLNQTLVLNGEIVKIKK